MGMCFAFFGRHAHGARGGKPYFSPRVPPFRPACCMEACGTQCGFFKLEALAPSPPAVGRLSARCHSAAPNILGAVAAPLCSDSLPRPLRARHRRASPRVLENAQGCSAPCIGSAQCALPVFRRLESPSGRQPTTSERHVCRPCPQYRHCAMRSASQPPFFPQKKNNFCTLQGLFFLRDAVK